jgi:hypothetical protein
VICGTLFTTSCVAYAVSARKYRETYWIANFNPFLGGWFNKFAIDEMFCNVRCEGTSECTILQRAFDKTGKTQDLYVIQHISIDFVIY